MTSAFRFAGEGLVTLLTPSFEGSHEGRVQALIDTDPSGKILSEELAWVPASRGFWCR